MKWSVLLVLGALQVSAAEHHIVGDAGYNDVAKFSCYSCSSMSPLCKGRVHDGQYLGQVQCQSSCFLRTEADGSMYRGCFDGWLGGMISHGYSGCRMQVYLGEEVEWCFCRGAAFGEPCNGESRTQIHQGAYHLQGNADSLNFIQPQPKMNTDFEPLAEPPTMDPAESSFVSVGPCDGRLDGTYRDPFDCRRYYHCNNGIAYRMRCPPGTAWNQKLMACAYSPVMPAYACDRQPTTSLSSTVWPNDLTTQSTNDITSPGSRLKLLSLLKVKDDEAWREMVLQHGEYFKRFRGKDGKLKLILTRKPIKPIK